MKSIMQILSIFYLPYLPNLQCQKTHSAARWREPGNCQNKRYGWVHWSHHWRGFSVCFIFHWTLTYHSQETSHQHHTAYPRINLQGVKTMVTGISNLQRECNHSECFHSAPNSTWNRRHYAIYPYLHIFWKKWSGREGLYNVTCSLQSPSCIYRWSTCWLCATKSSQWTWRIKC